MRCAALQWRLQTAFADPFSVNIGSSINFKIESPASSYAIEIYRSGYYGGSGARASASPSRRRPTSVNGS
jgi:hypothetical protein